MAARKRARTVPSTQRGGTKLIASNRRARHDYEVLDVVEAGVVLTGSEVKSLRLGHVQLADAFARSEAGELWLEGVHIAPYQFATDAAAHDPDRRRKLLLHRDEIDRLHARVAQERLALVPLRLYFREGRAKVEIALGRGRRKADQRQAIAERDSQREIDRAMGRAAKGF
jgi:SsrA-binding protein